jgi:hypothetical protein
MFSLVKQQKSGEPSGRRPKASSNAIDRCEILIDAWRELVTPSKL